MCLHAPRRLGAKPEQAPTNSFWGHPLCGLARSVRASLDAQTRLWVGRPTGPPHSRR